MDANALIKAAEDSRAVSYAFVSATALICFDICAVLPREVTHIWRAKWSGSKVLYLLARYHGAFVIFMNCAVHTRLQTSLSVSPLRPYLIREYAPN
ncbi:hypothetical protein BJ165DRAFT_218219 [Panaeolus papilionaceus]|nr:hypothetical protein BJ165DRAFT_218219 [Panaeolus papilionaceus]